MIFFSKITVFCCAAEKNDSLENEIQQKIEFLSFSKFSLRTSIQFQGFVVVAR
jgi:hypothetical protein